MHQSITVVRTEEILISESTIADRRCFNGFFSHARNFLTVSRLIMDQPFWDIYS